MAAKRISGPEDAQACALREAAQWYARLAGETATARDREAWQVWYEAGPANQAAWDKVQAVCRQLGQLPGALVVPTLQASARQRRVFLGSIAAAACALPVAWWSARELPWQRWGAAHRTGVGERRTLELPDGSTLVLDTGTALDIAFDDRTRSVLLHAGGVLADVRRETEPARSGAARPFAARPFIVATPQGSVRALGTRFTVSTRDEISHVEVIEHAVQIRTADGFRPPPLGAGRQQRFNRAQAGPATAANPFAGSWAQGNLVVVDLPLGAWTREMARYRHGVLNCDPAVADLKISGAFSLDDTDAALAALVNGFPVRIRRRTDYWVTLLPR